MKLLDSLQGRVAITSDMWTVSNHKCGSNAFQGYFDDAKESRVKKIPKIQEWSFQESSFKNQDSKNNQDQDSRLKIQESREESIKISIKKVFQNIK